MALCLRVPHNLSFWGAYPLSTKQLRTHEPDHAFPLLPFMFLQDNLFIPCLPFTSSVNTLNSKSSEMWRTKTREACRPPASCLATFLPGAMSREPGVWEKEDGPRGKPDADRNCSAATQALVPCSLPLPRSALTHSCSGSVSYSWRSSQCPCQWEDRGEQGVARPPGCPHFRTMADGECSTTASVGGKQSSFVAFAAFCEVTIPTRADFKLPTGWSWEEMHT